MLHFYELTYIADSICQRICMLMSLRFDNSIILHVNSLQIDELNRIFFLKILVGRNKIFPLIMNF